MCVVCFSVWGVRSERYWEKRRGILLPLGSGKRQGHVNIQFVSINQFLLWQVLLLLFYGDCMSCITWSGLFCLITQVSTLVLNKIYLSYFKSPSSGIGFPNSHLKNIIIASIANISHLWEQMWASVHLKEVHYKQNQVTLLGYGNSPALQSVFIFILHVLSIFLIIGILHCSHPAKE